MRHKTLSSSQAREKAGRIPTSIPGASESSPHDGRSGATSVPGLRRAWIVVTAMGAVLGMPACSRPQDSGLPPEGQGAPPPTADLGPNAGPHTLTQVELARRRSVRKLTGTVEVPGLEKGQIQLDIFEAGADPTNQQPITTIRLQKPGPFSLLLPGDVSQVDVRGVIDITGDGPTYDDAFMAYPDNPVSVPKEGASMSFKMDKLSFNKPPPGMGSDADRPPWERQGAAGVPGTAPGGAPGGAPGAAPANGSGIVPSNAQQPQGAAAPVGPPPRR